MKNYIIAFLAVALISCNPDDDTILKDYTVENEQEIVDYIALHGLDATRSNSGLYYVIDELGGGAEITSTSDVSIVYKGFFSDGSLYDESTDDAVSFNLQEAIRGLAEGLQYFYEGGVGTILIPSHLAFGSKDSNGIPGGSVLIFEFQLIDYVVENDEEILDYITNNNLENDAISTGTGLYYVINEQGSGEVPTSSSNVTVAYKGYYTDGEVFDESSADGVSFNLGGVIQGWTEGIQYFNEGGSGILLIPSHLAYGRFNHQGIPGGSVLVFDVNLKSVN